MSELRLENYTMPASRLGEESPLPPLDGCLPYTLQNNYDREKAPREFKTVVLENDILKAVFLIELGGRLWSLFHKKKKKELLYVNPVFQPANLAIRNAWFSGGVEWNMGLFGHSVFTCSPVFAARLRMDDGTPVLRMYEWERIRMVAYQIDVFLPEGSDFLFVRVRIVNPHEHEIPMYWWSNIAVPETPVGRVVVPAESAYRHNYQGKTSIVSVPMVEGVDQSYPGNFNRSADIFYRLNPDSQPWITALEGDGRGLIQTSTKRLLGRKLFVWGMHQGGRYWQEFLSAPGSAYIELQAGLTQIQSKDYLQMPADADWSWLEAYGLMECAPELIRGADWKTAYGSVDAALKNAMPLEKLELMFAETAHIADKTPEDIMHRGSGWGALERIRREKCGEPPFCSGSLVFDDAALGKEQEPWLELLNSGLMPYSPPEEKPPCGWMIQRQWQLMLEESVQQSENDHWLSWLCLGVMHYGRGEFEKAGQMWEKSLKIEPSPWAYRNLAMLAIKNNFMENAADLLAKAVKMAPEVYNLAVEYCKVLIETARYETLVKYIDSLPAGMRNRGRIKIMEAQAALKQDDLERTEKILRSRPSFADVREGENILSDIWFEMHERRIAKIENKVIGDELKQRVRKEFPPPAWLDFRQSA